VAAVYAALLVVGTLQVFFRYVIGFSLIWSEEAARFLFVYLVFIGAAIGIRRGTHIGVDLLVQALPSGARRGVRLFSDLLVLAFSLVLLWLGARIAAATMAQVSAAMGLPMGSIYAALALGGALMSVEAALRLRATLRKEAGGPSGTPHAAGGFE
jgi:TRAP-type C4-dicarboxylate transport system permease small subunit